MASNGTIVTYMTGGGGGAYGHTLTVPTSPAPMVSTFSWEIISQDVVNATTTVHYTYVISVPRERTDFEYIKYMRGWAYENNIPNQSSYVTNKIFEGYPGDNGYYHLKVGESVTVAEGNYTFAHKDDGSRTVGIMFNFAANGAYKMVNGVETQIFSTAGSMAGYVETTFVLDPIAMQGVIYTAPNFNDEESPTITYAMPAKCTEAYVGIALNGSTMTVPYRAVAVSSSSYTFNFTESEKKALWKILAQGTDTAEARFYIKTTYQGNTLTYYEPRTLTIINYMPTLDPEVYDNNTDIVNRLTGNKWNIVRYASIAKWSTGGKAYKGATISTQTVKNGETTQYGASGTMANVTSPTFNFTILDSYGRNATATYHLEESLGQFIPYVRLTCSAKATEMTADGNVQVIITGKCFDGDFGIKTNRLRLNYDISKNNEDFTHVDLGYADLAANYGNSFFVDGNDYTYTLNITGLEYLSVYEVTIRVSDEITVEPAETQTVLASTPMFDWGRTDFNFNVDVSMQGDLTVAGDIKAGGNTVPTIVAQGTAGIWTYRTWSDGTAECWGKKDFTVNVTSQWGSMYTSGAISGSNISFPYGLFTETPIVNASLLVRSAGGILMAPGGAGSNIASMDQTGVYEIARGTSLSNAAYTINYQVIGKWK